MLSTLPCLHPLCLLRTLTSRTAVPAPERGRYLLGRGRTAYDHHGGGGGALWGTGGAASYRVGMTFLRAGSRQRLKINMQKWTTTFIYLYSRLFFNLLVYIFLFYGAHGKHNVNWLIKTKRGSKHTFYSFLALAHQDYYTNLNPPLLFHPFPGKVAPWTWHFKDSWSIQLTESICSKEIFPTFFWML